MNLKEGSEYVLGVNLKEGSEHILDIELEGRIRKCSRG
jgi:hypothetical protein